MDMDQQAFYDRLNRINDAGDKKISKYSVEIPKPKKDKNLRSSVDFIDYEKDKQLDFALNLNKKGIRRENKSLNVFQTN